ncbi:hypothetical protein AMR75_02885 [Vibrio fluvialis]|nr:hypothetical protein AMR75_02885 [Vibrio fluvialis]
MIDANMTHSEQGLWVMSQQKWPSHNARPFSVKNAKPAPFILLNHLDQATTETVTPAINAEDH